MPIRPFLLLLLASPLHAWGQATPTATPQPSIISGLNLPSMTGSFQYGVSASEVFSRGYSSTGDTYAQTTFSGDVAYTSKSETHPFSMLYAGGVQIGNQANSTTDYFQSLALTQAYITRSWVFSASDVVSYLPQSPTVGLSGIPGTGDIGLSPIQTGTQPSQDILTVENSRLSNVVTGTVERRLDAFTSLSGSASYGTLSFLGDDGLDSTQISANAGINRRLDARSSASLSASYGTFRYSSLGDGASFQTKGLSLGYQRQLTRALGFSAAGGPEWISSSSTLAIPSRLTFTASASLNYSVRIYTAGVNYSRAVTGGAGVQPGGITDSIIAVVQRPFGTAWSASANVGYSRTQGLSDGATPVDLEALGITTSGDYAGEFAGVQVSRRLTRTLSAYASYNIISQDYNQTYLSPTALNGIVQSFAIGISYFPRSLHLGQF